MLASRMGENSSLPNFYLLHPSSGFLELENGPLIATNRGRLSKPQRSLMVAKRALQSEQLVALCQGGGPGIGKEVRAGYKYTSANPTVGLFSIKNYRAD